MNRKIIFYKTVDGKCPVQDFLDALPGKVAQKVAWVLRLLEDLEMVPATYFKKLIGTEEIWSAESNMDQTFTEYSASLTAIRWLY